MTRSTLTTDDPARSAGAADPGRVRGAAVRERDAVCRPDTGGGMRSARLGERGRQYVERLRDTRPRDQEITISGRITELRESGWVKVKTGTAKNAPAYDVHFEDPETLLRMRPGLGDNVPVQTTPGRRRHRACHRVHVPGAGCGTAFAPTGDLSGPPCSDATAGPCHQPVIHDPGT
ncbi:hypothetical protein ACFPZI_05635 [Streptomyces chlorus]|uniref:Uncharacterized protein n=1 Tax=Streptomyces chlorus TaxID=887452 RepID=A0ABW1DSH0_9ACTN